MASRGTTQRPPSAAPLPSTLHTPVMYAGTPARAGRGQGTHVRTIFSACRDAADCADACRLRAGRFAMSVFHADSNVLASRH